MVDHYQWHIDRWRGAVGSLTFGEQAVYRNLIDQYYHTDGHAKDDDTAVARLCKIPINHYRRIKARLIEEAKIVIADGFIVPNACEEELAKIQAKSEKARKAAEVKHARLGRSSDSGSKPLKTNDSTHANAETGKKCFFGRVTTHDSAGNLLAHNETGHADAVQTLNHKEDSKRVASPTDSESGTETLPTASEQSENLPRQRSRARARESPEDDSRINGSKYAFAGKVVRLTRKDLDDWRRMCPNIPSLETELTDRDAWLVERPLAKKKWFISTSAWLRDRNTHYASRQTSQPITRDRLVRAFKGFWISQENAETRVDAALRYVTPDELWQAVSDATTHNDRDTLFAAVKAVTDAAKRRRKAAEASELEELLKPHVREKRPADHKRRMKGDPLYAIRDEFESSVCRVVTTSWWLPWLRDHLPEVGYGNMRRWHADLAAAGWEDMIGVLRDRLHEFDSALHPSRADRADKSTPMDNMLGVGIQDLDL